MTGAWRIAVVVPAAAAPAIERALEPFADMALALIDADPAACRYPGDPQPATWHADLWLAKTCLVEGLASIPPDPAALRAALAIAAAAAGISEPAPLIQPLGARDWVAETYDAFPEISVGRYRIRGSHIAEPAANGSVPITIDAAIAFGTGEHETTRGCLIALDRLSRRFRPRSVLDLGCGSGVLGIAAARTWRDCRVVLADIDRRAVSVARQNAARNGVSGRVLTVIADGYRSVPVRDGAPYDLILSNILARPLVRLAPALMRHLACGGYGILSGFLSWQEAQVLSAHRAQGLRLVEYVRLGDWTTVIIAR